MTRLLVSLPLAVLMAGPASAQSFAPAQARAAEPPPQQSRFAPGGPARLGTGMELNTSLLSTGMPVPAPAGAMAEASGMPGLISARVPTGGALVTVPPEAVASSVRLYTYLNPQGGLESVAYDPSTGATVVYDQTISYSLQNRLGQAGPGLTPRAGSSAAAGIINNPSFSLQPGRANPDVGIPLLNQAAPSYVSQSNLGLGQTPRSPGLMNSPFSGSPMAMPGTIPPMTSPFDGTPMGTLGSTPAMTSPFSGSPMGTLGSSPGFGVGVGGAPSFSGSLGGGSFGGGASGGGSFGGGAPSFSGSLGGGSP